MAMTIHPFNENEIHYKGWLSMVLRLHQHNI